MKGIFSKESPFFIGLFFVLIASNAFAFERDDLLFYAPFEGTADALYSRGAPKAAALIEKGFTFAEGIRGKCIVIGGKKEGEKGGMVLQYSAKNNLLPKAGTISFWSKALDWTKHPKNGGYFTWLSFWPKEPGGIAQIYRYGEGGMTAFRVAVGGKQSFTWSSWPSWEWSEGIWQHIVYSWSPGEESYFLNGRLEVRRTENVFSFKGIGDTFDLGSYRAVRTAIDELYIFKKALSPSEVQALYRLGSGQLTAPRFCAGRVKPPPVIDGKIAPGEWDEAAVVDNFIDGVLGVQSEERILAYAGFDEKNLYLALHYAIPEILRKSPQLFPEGALKRKASKRDADMSGDDYYEIILAAKERGPHYHFRINALGTMADDKDGDLKWDGKWKAKSFDDLNAWSVEMAIPFSDIGVSPQEGASLRLNIKRNWAITSKKWAALALGGGSRELRIGKPGRDQQSLTRKGGETLGFAEVTLAGSSPIARIEEIQNLGGGTVGINGTIYNPGAAASVKVTVSAGGLFESETSLRAESGKTSPFQIAGSLKGEGGGDLTIEFAAGDKTFYRSAIPFSYSSSFTLEKYIIPSRNLLRAVIRPGIEAPADIEAIGKMFAEENDRNELARGTTREFAHNEGHIDFDISKLSPGKYSLRISIFSAGKEIAKKSLSFAKQKPPVWLGNTIGKPKKVPIPWTPVKVEGTNVFVWGREYRFDKSILFSQVASAGEELLAGPLRILVKKEEALSEVKAATSTCIEKSELKAVMVASGSSGGLSVKAKTLIEFDGFTWTTLTFKPEKNAPVKVDALAIEVPFKPEHSTLYYVGDYTSGTLGNIKPWKSETFGPWQWLGDENAGIQWYAQSDRNWWSQGEKGQIEIIPKEKENLLRLNLMTRPATISEPVEIKLGFMATPVSPKRPDWRRFRNNWFAGDREKRLMLWFTHWSKGVSWPVLKPMSDPVWQTHARYRAEGLVPHLYLGGATTSPFSPEYRYFQEEWRPIPSPRYDIDAMSKSIGVGGGEENRVQVCPKSSFQDFLVYYLAKAVREEERDIQGFYFDNTWPQPCMNEYHGCGYVGRDGERHPEMPILADREMFKRIYVSMKEARPNNMLSFHMSGQLYMPMLSFAGVWLDGEQFASGLQRHFRETGQKNFYDYMTLDKFRAEFMGHQWGGQLTYLLSEIWTFTEKDNKESAIHYWMGGDPEIDRVAEHLSGMGILHDVQPACGTNVSNVIMGVEEEFGWDEKTEFLPYWDNAKYITLDSGAARPVVCSIFRRENDLMLVLFNDSDKDANVKVKINFDALGVKRSPAYILRDPIGYNRHGGGAFNKKAADWTARGMRKFWASETELLKTYGNKEGLFLLFNDSTTVPVMKRNFRILLVE